MTPAPALHLSGSARYDGAPVFGPLEFTAPAGTWTCLLGPSGVGKSTMLRLLAGLDSGVTFEGSLGADDGAPLQDRIALMAQSDLLLEWRTVLDNITLGAALRSKAPDMDRAHRVLGRVGLADHASKKPGALSGGQRQRVALARTLMEDRPVVLLDEPFSALDARNRSLMQDLSAELLAGRTVVQVTHDAAEAARMGDKILVMSQDRLTEVPPPATTPPRQFDAPDTLVYQGQLLRLLMETA